MKIQFHHGIIEKSKWNNKIVIFYLMNIGYQKIKNNVLCQFVISDFQHKYYFLPKRYLIHNGIKLES
jgi:hypothetical protein